LYPEVVQLTEDIIYVAQFTATEKNLNDKKIFQKNKKIFPTF